VAAAVVAAGKEKALNISSRAGNGLLVLLFT
jgi:hypothetical protein